MKQIEEINGGSMGRYDLLNTGRSRFRKDEGSDAQNRLSDRGKRGESISYYGNYLYK